MEAAKINGIYRVTGKETYDLKAKIKKYGFTWNTTEKAWDGDEDAFEVLVQYVKKFKGIDIEVIEEAEKLEDTRTVEIIEEKALEIGQQVEANNNEIVEIISISDIKENLFRNIEFKIIDEDGDSWTETHKIRKDFCNEKNIFHGAWRFCENEVKQALKSWEA